MHCHKKQSHVLTVEHTCQNDESLMAIIRTFFGKNNVYDSTIKWLIEKFECTGSVLEVELRA